MVRLREPPKEYLWLQSSGTNRRRRRRDKTPASANLTRKFFLGVILVSLVGLFSGTALGAAYISSVMKDLPDIDDLSSLKKPERTKIFAADGTLLTTLFVENRESIPLSKIPEVSQQAFVSAEDERFFKHRGVDPVAIMRAALVDLERGEVVEGGSTITQQLVKNSFLEPEFSLERKIREAYIAYELEKRLPKERIFELYLNTIYFGHGAHGIGSAAETYFGKKVEELTLAESALLAGLVRLPERYSPYINKEKAFARRDKVLDKMLTLGVITSNEAFTAKRATLEFNPSPTPNVLIAPYFVEYIKQEILNNPEYGATKDDRFNFLFKGGLKIQTSLDPKMQKAAEKAAATFLDKPADPSVAVVAIDPKTGFVKAMVGGRDYESQKFNLAVQGRRQAGSAFKTFVLITALEQEISPLSVYDSSPLEIKLEGSEPWKVDNYTAGKSYGPITIWEATVRSVNATFARLVMDVEAEKVAATAKRMGIASTLLPVPSIALGSQAVSPLDMASAYATLANEGRHVPPTGITKITDAGGEVVKSNVPEAQPAIDADIAADTTRILQDVPQWGTGRRARINRPMAGKTGTAQQFRDAWFVGYTPNLAAAVWVGYPEGEISMMSVHGIRVVGGSYPAMIWKTFMTEAVKDLPPDDFPEASLKGYKIEHKARARKRSGRKSKSSTPSAEEAEQTDEPGTDEDVESEAPDSPEAPVDSEAPDSVEE